MNVIGLLFLLVIAVAALGGLYMIASSPSSQPVTDTYGATITNSTNHTMSTVQNMTTTGLGVGGGVILFVGFIILLVILVALAAIVF